MAVKIFGTFLAVLTFAILIETPKKQLIFAGIVGAVGGASYLISETFGMETVTATFVSAISIALMSHIFARVLKKPVTLFLIAGILPTVPGAGMYRTVYYIIAGDRSMSSYYLVQTAEVAGAIALAIFIIDTLFRLFLRGWKQNSLQYVKKKNKEQLH